MLRFYVLAHSKCSCLHLLPELMCIFKTLSTSHVKYVKKQRKEEGRREVGRGELRGRRGKVTIDEGRKEDQGGEGTRAGRLTVIESRVDV